MKRLKIELNKAKPADLSYYINLENNVFKGLGELLESNEYIAVVDSNIAKLYHKDIESLFNKDRVFVFEANENKKSFESLLEILSFFSEKQAKRDTKVLAIGGGVVGDIVGFASSIYKRGIDFIQIPTTLLAMVDSSVGGKTGINHFNSKNNIGSFYQPKAVYIYTDFLKTVTREAYLDGVAEIIKYGALFNRELFDDVLLKSEQIINKEIEILEEIILICCKHKADVVVEDEKEGGVRKLLNFGHTIGHAIEADSSYEVSHGFAVAIGMVLELQYAASRSLIPSGLCEKIIKVLKEYNYPIHYEIRDYKLFSKALGDDKKMSSKGLNLAVISDIGEGKILQNIEYSDIINYLKSL